MAIPNTPSKLSVIADGGYASISLKWIDNSDDEDGFKIESSPNGVSGWSQIDTVGANVTYYQDAGLSAGTPYYYRVRAYSGGDNSPYTNIAKATTFQLSDVGAPYLQLDADLGVYKDAGITPAGDADTVQEWHDQSGNDYDVTQTTEAAKPTLQTNEINGLPVIRFASGDILKASTASDWKFLHDGSAFTVFVVWKATSTNPDALYMLLDTGGISTADIGFGLFYDDRSGSSKDEQLYVVVNRGTGGSNELVFYTANRRSVGAGRWHVSGVHRESAGDGTINNDGHWGGDGTGSPDGSPSASDPTSALAVGARYDNTFNLVGDIAYILIYDSYLSSTNYKRVTQYLGDRFAQDEYLFFEPATILVDVDGETYDYAVCGGMTVAPNGDLVMSYLLGDSHTTNWDEVYIMISDDKGSTWGAPTKIFDFQDDGGSSTMYIPQFFTAHSDGRLLLKAGKVVSGSLVIDGLAYWESDDNGDTWSSPIAVPGNGTDYDWGGGGPIIELANGDLLFPYRYRDTGDGTLWTTAVSKSVDGGDNWAVFTDIAQGTQYDEPGLVQLANDDIICLIRDDGSSPRTIRYCISDDNGATWDVVTYAIDGGGPQVPMLLEGGLILAPMRYANIYNARAPEMVLTSPDSGTSWQCGHEFEKSPNDTGAGQPMYGQFVQDLDGSIYFVYGTETTENDSSDIMFTRAVRGTMEIPPPPNNIAAYQIEDRTAALIAALQL